MVILLTMVSLEDCCGAIASEFIKLDIIVSCSGENGIELRRVRVFSWCDAEIDESGGGNGVMPRGLASGWW